MEVKIFIDGMMCSKCSGRVEKAFNQVDGIEANVNLEEKTAYLKLSGDFSDDELTKIVTDAGYTVTKIQR